jgi:hypothetical protein
VAEACPGGGSGFRDPGDCPGRLGALIVRQAGNLIGWIMLAAGSAQAFLTIASIYAVIGIATFPGSLPAAKQVGTLAECTFPVVVLRQGRLVLLR